MDLVQKESISEIAIENEKCCTDCKTTKTPLWRGGPAGPKTLCNACGIRHRKKRSMINLKKVSEKKKQRSNVVFDSSKSPSTTTVTGNSGCRNDNYLSKSLKMKLMLLGKEVVLLQRQRSSLVRKGRRREIGEEEEAAALLMSLSCGSVFA